jgi:hypothetical protein
MHRNILLTLLFLLVAVVAVDLSPARRAAAAPDDENILATRASDFKVQALPLPRAVEFLSKKTQLRALQLGKHPI